MRVEILDRLNRVEFAKIGRVEQSRGGERLLEGWSCSLSISKGRNSRDADLRERAPSPRLPAASEQIVVPCAPVTQSQHASS